MTARDRQEGGEHYKRMDVQPWDVIDTWPIEQQIGFYRGNVVKYVLRAGSKGGAAGQVEDLRKAAHYLQKLSEILRSE